MRTKMNGSHPAVLKYNNHLGYVYWSRLKFEIEKRVTRQNIKSEWFFFLRVENWDADMSLEDISGDC